MEKICRNVIVTGRVQGVAFRAGVAQQATQEGVHGYAKNLQNGNVEVLLEGSPQAVQKVLLWCQHGTPAARVDHLEVTEIASSAQHGFKVL